MDKIAAEGRAWAILQRPAPRGRYEHARSWEIRNNHRRSFVRRINRTPGGCWLWTGQSPERGGKPYPMVGWRVRRSGRAALHRSAFTWMMEEWFPEEHAKLPHRTTTTCGNNLCLNPYHRVDKMNTQNKITAEQAVELYALKGRVHSAEVAEQFGISRNQVLSIWRGRNWASVTGAVKPPPVNRKTPPEVEARIIELKGTGSSRQIAEQLNISYKTVLRVWKQAEQPVV